jgi:hypothetical protein
MSIIIIYIHLSINFLLILTNWKRRNIDMNTWKVAICLKYILCLILVKGTVLPCRLYLFESVTGFKGLGQDILRFNLNFFIFILNFKVLQSSNALNTQIYPTALESGRDEILFSYLLAKIICPLLRKPSSQF